MGIEVCSEEIGLQRGSDTLAPSLLSLVTVLSKTGECEVGARGRQGGLGYRRSAEREK